MSFFSLSSPDLSSVCGWILISSLCKEASHIWSRPTHIISFYLNYLFKGLSSKYSHLLKYWRLGLQCVNFITVSLQQREWGHKPTWICKALWWCNHWPSDGSAWFLKRTKTIQRGDKTVYMPKILWEDHIPHPVLEGEGRWERWRPYSLIPWRAFSLGCG